MPGRKLLLVLAALWVISASPVRAEPTITVVTWGGPYERSQTKAYFEPFTAATGIRIEVERYNGGIAEIREQVQGGNVEWDLVDMTMADNRAACRQGLLEPLDHSRLEPALDGTPAREDFIDGALTPCGVTQIVYAMVMAYNRDAFPGEKPRQMADLFDLERFPGKRALQKTPEANLEWALMSYGVPHEDLYHLLSTERGLRLAFDRLDSIKDHIIWWTDTDRPVELLMSGEVVMASQYNGRLFDAAVVHGHPIEIIWDRQVYELGAWGIPQGFIKSRRGRAVYPIRHRYAAARGASQVRRLRTSAEVFDKSRVDPRGDGGRHAPAHADSSGQFRNRDPQRHGMVRGASRPNQTSV